MRAAVFHAGAARLALATVPDPTPAEGEVTVRVRGAGVCGSDLGFLAGLALPPGVASPVVLGHEVAGEVAALGPGVAGVRPGDRVLVNPYVACEACHACRAGRRSICARPAVIGLHRPGGFAERVAVPAASLHRLPAGLPFAEAAVVPDAVSTAYHALVTRGGLAAGRSVAVLGAGGLGHHGLLLARLLGASPVVAVVRREAVAGRVRALGVEVVVGEGADAARGVRRATGGLGADLVVDFVGSPDTVRAAVRAARIGGTVVVVGVSDAPLDLVPSAHLVRYEIDLKGAYGADPAEIDAVLSLVGEGRLDLSASVSRRCTLEELPDAVESLRARPADVVRLVMADGGR